MRRCFATAIAAVIWLGCGAIAGAEDYPTRPITMIVPFPAGGATDTVARFLAEKMRMVLGQPIVI
ncbi:MAG TPA: tripartite tricarboxylate transporter substrate binding protein BugD, partial [Bradyrhizobium sp.]